MDGIAKLKGVSTWANVQQNQFSSHGDEADKVFGLKMSKVSIGVGSTWLGANNLARTTMACHVYCGNTQTPKDPD